VKKTLARKHMEKERQKEALSIVFPGMVNGALILYNKKKHGSRTTYFAKPWNMEAYSGQ
jgi:hypothetical protein